MISILVSWEQHFLKPKHNNQAIIGNNIIGNNEIKPKNSYLKLKKTLAKPTP